MPKSQTSTGAAPSSRGGERAREPERGHEPARDHEQGSERVPVQQAEGTERTRDRPVYAPRVDIVETVDALEILADMPGVTRESVEVTLEQRVLSIRGRADGQGPPQGMAPLHLEYRPGDYERSFTLSDAVDPAGIEARVRNGVLRLRLPKAGPAKRQRIEVSGD